MLITSNAGQTVFDIALQYCGSAEMALSIAIANDLSLTDAMPAGTVLEVPAQKNDVTDYFKSRGMAPATEA